MIFGKKLSHTEYVFWFPIRLLSKIFLILGKIQSDIVINVENIPVKYPFFLSDFTETLIFSTDFRKTKSSNLIKIRLVRAELFHADGRTDMTKLIAAFRNFSNAPKHSTVCPYRVFMCLVRTSEKKKTATVYLRSIDWLVFITAMTLFTARYAINLYA